MTRPLHHGAPASPTTSCIIAGYNTMVAVWLAVAVAVAVVSRELRVASCPLFVLWLQEKERRKGTQQLYQVSECHPVRRVILLTAGKMETI